MDRFNNLKYILTCIRGSSIYVFGKKYNTPDLYWYAKCLAPPNKLSLHFLMGFVGLAQGCKQKTLRVLCLSLCGLATGFNATKHLYRTTASGLMWPVNHIYSGCMHQIRFQLAPGPSHPTCIHHDLNFHDHNLYTHMLFTTTFVI